MASRWLIAVAAVLVTALGIWLLVVVRSAGSSTPTPPTAPPTPSAPRPRPSAVAPAAPAATDSPDTDTPAPTPTPTPVVPPAPHPEDPRVTAARTKRLTMLSKVRSGPESHDAWTSPGSALLDHLATTATDTADRGCFAGGCTATFTFKTDAAYRAAVAAWRVDPDVKAWTGGMRFSDPEVRDGGTVVVGIVIDHPK